MFGNPGTFIVNDDFNCFWRRLNRHACCLAVLDRIVEEVADRSLQGIGPAVVHNWFDWLHFDGHAGVDHVVDDALDKRCDVGGTPNLSCGLVPGELQSHADHRVHFSDGRKHLVALLRIFNVFGA